RPRPSANVVDEELLVGRESLGVEDRRVFVEPLRLVVQPVGADNHGRRYVGGLQEAAPLRDQLAVTGEHDRRWRNWRHVNGHRPATVVIERLGDELSRGGRPHRCSQTARSGEAQGALGSHGAEQALQGDFHVLAPGQRRLGLKPQPRVAQMRTYRLEADGQQVFGRGYAAHAVGLQVTKGLDTPDSAPGEVLDQSLHEHPPEPAAGELGDDVRVHHEDGVGANRTGGEGEGAGNVQRWCKEYVTRRNPIDIYDFSATAPLQKNVGYPRLFLDSRIPGFDRLGLAHRVEFPEDATPAP